MLTTFAVESILNRPEEAKSKLDERLAGEEVEGAESQLLVSDRIGHMFRVTATDTPRNRQKLERLFGTYNLVIEDEKEAELQRSSAKAKIERLNAEIAVLQAKV